AASSRPLPARGERKELSQLQLPPPLRQRAQPQSVEADKTFGVTLVVADLAVLEGDEVLIVKRILAVAADQTDIALIQFQSHPAGDEFLASIDGRLQHFALGRKPEAVIDRFRIFRHQLVLEMRRAAIERNRFDGAMRGKENSAAGGLIH